MPRTGPGWRLLTTAVVCTALGSAASSTRAAAQGSAEASLSATAPRLTAAVVPVLPVAAFGGGELVFELAVSAAGTVTGVRELRVTPPYTRSVREAVAAWRFAPATAAVGDQRRPVPGETLVIALFRAPTLYAGPSPGTPPETRAVPSPTSPRVTSALAPPVYPIGRRGDGVVIIELELTADGAVAHTRVVSPASPFDAAALDAVRRWRFALPRSSPRPVVYAIVGFRAPVVGH